MFYIPTLDTKITMLCIAIPYKRWLLQLPMPSILHAQDAHRDACATCILVLAYFL